MILVPVVSKYKVGVLMLHLEMRQRFQVKKI